MMREILEKLSWSLCITCSNPSVPDYDKENINTAITQLKSELLGKLPKEKIKIWDASKVCNGCRYGKQWCQCDGFNDCLSQVKQVINEMCK